MRQKTLKIIMVLVVLLGAQVAGAEQATLTYTSVPAPITVLKLGSRGGAVTALQEQLKGISGVYPEALITGYFGTLTEKAVKRLQAQNDLEQVGFVGPKTRELLLKLSTNQMDSGMNDRKVAPQILEVNSMVTSTTTAYVFWTTNKYTTSDFYYANSTPLASTTPLKISDSNMSFTHSVNISGLVPNTTYYYMIKINDNRGNPATTTERSFTTLPN